MATKKQQDLQSFINSTRNLDQFEQFLAADKLNHNLDFVLAVQGMKSECQGQSASPENICQIVRTIHKCYFSRVNITEEIKFRVNSKMAIQMANVMGDQSAGGSGECAQLLLNVFDTAVDQVWQFLESLFVQKFIHQNTDLGLGLDLDTDLDETPSHSHSQNQIHDQRDRERRPLPMSNKTVLPAGVQKVFIPSDSDSNGNQSSTTLKSNSKVQTFKVHSKGFTGIEYINVIEQDFQFQSLPSPCSFRSSTCRPESETNPAAFADRIIGALIRDLHLKEQLSGKKKSCGGTCGGRSLADAFRDKFGLKEDAPDDILDDHVSRVWSESDSLNSQSRQRANSKKKATGIYSAFRPTKAIHDMGMGVGHRASKAAVYPSVSSSVCTGSEYDLYHDSGISTITASTSNRSNTRTTASNEDCKPAITKYGIV